MTAFARLAAGAVLACGLTLGTGPSWAADAQAAASTDAAAIHAVMMKTWDKPESRLTVAPVVAQGHFGLAGWTQGDRGGRAVLRKTAQGWQVHICGGDGVKDIAALQDAGLDKPTAQALVAALNAAEAKLPAEQVRKFSLFGANVMVGPAHGH